MTGTVGTILGLLAFWMAACCFCGLKGRFIAFLAVLFIGLATNMVWMVFGLQARPFETDALIAQGSATLFALCAFAIGLFLRRFLRAWTDSHVPRRDV